MNVTPDGIYVDVAGEWKLGGLDQCCAANDPDMMGLVRSIHGERVRYLAPEVQVCALPAAA
jgi:hypothetical protein